MSIFQKPAAQTLSEWLDIAMRKLTDASKQRIRTEIEAHYAEAVEAHREHGLSEAEARSKALKELGDAKAAARRFRKQHLTEREDERLKTSEKMARSIFWLILSYFFFGEFAFDQFPLRRNALLHFHYQSLGLSLEFVVLIVLPTLCLVIARLGSARPKRYLLLLQPMSGFVAGIFINQLFTADLLLFEYWITALLGLVLLTRFLLHLRLWIKLGKMGPTQSQIPPPDTAIV